MKLAAGTTLLVWFALVLAGMAADVGLVLAVAVGLAAPLARRRLRLARAVSHPRSRTVTFRSSGNGDLWATRLHEAGHVVMTRRVGGFVRRVTISADGSGLTESVFPPWADLDGIDDAACDYAGGLAEGVSVHSAPCSSDLAHARDTLRRGYTWSGRSWADRKARSLARSTVGYGLLGPRGSVVRVARRLPSPGTKRM